MKISRLDRRQILHRCLDYSSASPASNVITFNSLMAMQYSHNCGFRKAVKAADLIICDSIGIQVVSLVGERQVVRRYPGIEIMEEIVHRGVKSFFWGGKPGVAARAAERLSGKYPEADICGVSDGYFTPGQEKDIIEKINRLKPRALFVGLNIPRQEIFIHKRKEKLDVGLVMGVGGSFDVLSGSVSRAPGIFVYTGTEWFWRLVLQPWRLGRILSLSVFVLEAWWRFFKGETILKE